MPKYHNNARQYSGQMVRPLLRPSAGGRSRKARPAGHAALNKRAVSKIEAAVGQQASSTYYIGARQRQASGFVAV
eukprot:scaffold26977_cov104-Skeletonema_dohrnii-CCMP3373.AAC.1